MEISTSILNAKNREEALIELNNTQTKYIHIDVMDGKFVKDTQFTIEEIIKLNELSNKELDIHLMVENPLSYINKLANLNIKYITFHLEIEKDISEIINKIKKLGYKVGIAIKPNTDIDKLKPYLDIIDLILVMSVEPGKGGQKFIKETITRIEKIKKYNKIIEIDGGININTINLIYKADIAVVGSFIINSNNYKETIKSLIK